MEIVWAAQRREESGGRMSREEQSPCSASEVKEGATQSLVSRDFTSCKARYEE